MRRKNPLPVLGRNDGIGKKYVYANKGKYDARYDTIVKVYKSATGKDRVPAPKQYWTLCAEQTKETESEIIQLTSLGFIAHHQFHGIDRDDEKININKERFPQANWHFGEWIEIIKFETNDFNPAVVYFDTLNLVVSPKLWRDVAKTMMQCPLETLLVVNAMLNDPYSAKEFETFDFINGLCKELTRFECNRWHDFGKVYCYKSLLKKTTMATYCFYKEG